MQQSERERPTLSAIRCSVTNRIILDPCIVNEVHACDAFEVSLQIIAQYLDGVPGPEICLYRGFTSDSNVVASNMGSNSIVHAVPLIRKWFRRALISNEILVDTKLDAKWMSKIPEKEKQKSNGKWMLRACNDLDEFPVISYRSFDDEKNIHRIGWSDAPIQELAYVFRRSEHPACSPMNDSWNRANDLQIALGSGPLLFYGRIYPDTGNRTVVRKDEGHNENEVVMLAGCMHYRDGARANGFFSKQGLLNGSASAEFTITCPRGRVRFAAKQWAHGCPVGMYTGTMTTRLDSNFRYRFCGFWQGSQVSAQESHRERWFGYGSTVLDPQSADSRVDPIQDTIVHIIHEKDTRRGADAKSDNLDFQMTIKMKRNGISRAVGSPTGTLIHREGFCWVHIYDRSLQREFAVCFSGKVRWSNYDFAVGGPAVSFIQVEDIDLYGHLTRPTTTVARYRQLSSFASRADWLQNIPFAPNRSTHHNLYRHTPDDVSPISVFSVSRPADEGVPDGQNADQSPPSGARYEYVNLGDDTNRIIQNAHARMKHITNSWILACRDAITSRMKNASNVLRTSVSLENT